MPRQRSYLLSPTEWKVMKIVWERKTCPTRDICAIAREAHGWSASTVKTILRRLVGKGYLKITPVANCFLYRPARPALSSLLHAADTLLENALEGTTAPILIHMVKKGNLTSGEIKELQQLLETFAAQKEENR